MYLQSKSRSSLWLLVQTSKSSVLSLKEACELPNLLKARLRARGDAEILVESV